MYRGAARAGPGKQSCTSASRLYACLFSARRLDAQGMPITAFLNNKSSMFTSHYTGPESAQQRLTKRLGQAHQIMRAARRITDEVNCFRKR